MRISQSSAPLSASRVEHAIRYKAADPGPLAGLVFDANGERMSPTHAVKKRSRYRYYVGQSLIKRGRSKPSDAACRVQAADLEALVENKLRALLKQPATILEFAGTNTVAARKALIDQVSCLAQR